MRLNQVTLPALNIAVSVAFYRKLGFELIVSEDHYARFKSTSGDGTFSLHRVDHVLTPPQTIVYFECDELDRLVSDLKSKGVQFTQDPRDEPWLWREARLVDPTGNEICLYHAGANRLDPPWRVAADAR